MQRRWESPFHDVEHWHLHRRQMVNWEDKAGINMIWAKATASPPQRQSRQALNKSMDKQGSHFHNQSLGNTSKETTKYEDNQVNQFATATRSGWSCNEDIGRADERYGGKLEGKP